MVMVNEESVIPCMQGEGKERDVDYKLNFFITLNVTQIHSIKTAAWNETRTCIFLKIIILIMKLYMILYLLVRSEILTTTEYY